MENKLPTQQRSEEALIKKKIEAKSKIINGLKDNLYYIYITLMIIANCMLSLLKLENGSVGLNYPKSALGWALWVTQILVTTFIGVMILTAFRNQGIKQGHKTIKETYDDYLKAVTQQKSDINPRSLSKYKSQTLLRDSITKGSILIMLNLLVLSLIISANWNAVLALIVNIIFSVGFGLKAMLDGEEFVITELVIWYKLETKKLLEKETKHESIRRNTKPKTRPSKSSRVQQTEKLDTGRSDSEPYITSEQPA